MIPNSTIKNRFLQLRGPVENSHFWRLPTPIFSISLTNSFRLIIGRIAYQKIEKNFLYRIPSVSCDLSVISLIRKPKSIISKNLEAAVTVRRAHHVTSHSVDSGQDRVSEAVICTVEAWLQVQARIPAGGGIFWKYSYIWTPK